MSVLRKRRQKARATVLFSCVVARGGGVGSDPPDLLALGLVTKMEGEQDSTGGVEVVFAKKVATRHRQP